MNGTGRRMFGLLRTASAVGLALLLSGCVVYPAYGPHWHPRYGYYYR